MALIDSTANTSIEENLYKQLKGDLLDPLAVDLANSVHWLHLKNISQTENEKYPIAISGKGPPLLLLHGFDSSHLEFRRLVPLLNGHHKLLIPDLYGFGFCPRPKNNKYGKESLVLHLYELLNNLAIDSSVGLIGASMGGALAMEIARKYPEKVNRILLLCPAGLSGKPIKIPPLLDHLGACFLRQNIVRKNLCKQAFSDPKNSVGPPEEQIASLHLKVPGWSRSLAAFARSGGFANCGLPLPKQPIHSIWGDNDRILTGAIKKESLEMLNPNTEEISNCGHLPHLDKPNLVANRWLRASQY